jgi:hypothetical protein
MNNLIAKLKVFFLFYYDGFRSMSSWGRQVWIVIIIKLFIIFILLRIFFFPDILKDNFRNDNDRSDYIRNQILNTK